MTTPVASTKFSVLAIVGFILSFFVSLIGAIISIIAYVQIRRTGERGAGLAIAGIIIGVLSFIVGLSVGINAINTMAAYR